MRPAVADAIYWSAVACCVVAQVAILRSALARHRPLADAPTTLPPYRRSVEMVWALLPAIALAAVLGMTWRAVHRPANERPTDSPAPTASAVTSLQS